MAVLTIDQLLRWEFLASSQRRWAFRSTPSWPPTNQSRAVIEGVMASAIMKLTAWNFSIFFPKAPSGRVYGWLSPGPPGHHRGGAGRQALRIILRSNDETSVPSCPTRSLSGPAVAKTACLPRCPGNPANRKRAPPRPRPLLDDKRGDSLLGRALGSVCNTSAK